MSTDFFDLSALNADRLAARTIDQLADAYHDLKALKSTETAKRYRAEIEFFLTFMRRFGADPAAPTQPHVVRYLAYLASEEHPDHPGLCWHECAHLPYAASSRQHRLNVLDDFYNYAIANGLALAGNPCTGLYVHVPKKDAVDHLTEDEARTLWAEAGAKSWRDGTLIGLLLGCGMRKEEARLARVENLGRNEFGPTLKFWRVKGRYTQTIPLPTPVHEILTKHVGDRTHGPLLPSRQQHTHPDTGLREHKHLTDAGLDHIIHTIGTYSGVRSNDIYAHLMRYTSITFARTTTGLPLATTMTFYGHESLKDHKRYDAFARDTFVRPITNPAQGRGFWRLAA
ncbi:tyrosine-type recombinase/integrase [Streptomyces sp. NPDC017260]|uniref:tyrosine-type recombinase/integrase n=1 Tax=unclassified Streptomyces TaxID=2593676 RepID=UPI0037B1668C